MKKIYEALIYLLDDCNYSCDYCMLGSPSYEKRKSRASNFEGTQAIIDFFRYNPDWHIFLSGGEPTVHPYFVQLVRELSKDNYLRIDTNGSNHIIIRHTRLENIANNFRSIV